MTNYSKWEKKATDLCREAEEEDEAEKKACDEALGLTEGPKGPTTAKAEEEMKQLGEHSTKREDFIAWSKGREVLLSHNFSSGEGPVVLSGEELQGKAVRLKGSKGVSYVIPEGSKIVKLMVDAGVDLLIHVKAILITSSIELYKCERLELQLDHPMGMVQVDECTDAVSVHFAEKEHVGKFYHQNSPGLSVCWGFSGGNTEPAKIGKSGDFQLVTRLDGMSLQTQPVRRGEGEFPLDVGADNDTPFEQPEPGTLKVAEAKKQEAEKKRQEGNEMFRASDFAQAAALYSIALQLDPEQSAVWANRSQCWLKLGDHEKAFEDAAKCTEVEPSNPKGWFRKGMSLHAMKRYPAAISALLGAEKLEPTNKQILDAIKMSQLMARKEARS